MGGNATELQRFARYAVEAWSNPGQFKSPRDFMCAVFEVLDEMAKAAGKPLPSVEGLWEERYGD